MTGGTLVLVELLLVLGGVMGWALWELWSVRRSLRQDRERLLRQRHAAQVPSPPAEPPPDAPAHQRFD